MRVLRDVIIDQTSADELLAVSQAPGVLGEDMVLDLFGGGVGMRLAVRVLESRPVIIEGAVRHRLRLAIVRPAAEQRSGPVLTAGIQAAVEAL